MKGNSDVLCFHRSKSKLPTVNLGSSMGLIVSLETVGSRILTTLKFVFTLDSQLVNGSLICFI